MLAMDEVAAVAAGTRSVAVMELAGHGGGCLRGRGFHEIPVHGGGCRYNMLFARRTLMLLELPAAGIAVIADHAAGAAGPTCADGFAQCCLGAVVIVNSYCDQVGGRMCGRGHGPSFTHTVTSTSPQSLPCLLYTHYCCDTLCLETI